MLPDLQRVLASLADKTHFFFSYYIVVDNFEAKYSNKEAIFYTFNKF